VALRITDTFDLARWSEMDRFLAETYRPDYVMRERKLFDWQFRNPADPGAVCMLCAFEDDELIGIMGYMPLPLLWGGGGLRVDGAWAANWIVAKGRRSGPGVLLMRRLTEMFDVVLGQGAGKMNEVIVAKMGFAFHPEIPRYGCVLEPEATLAALRPDASPEERDGVQGLAPSLRPNAEPVTALDTIDAPYSPDWKRYGGLGFGTLRDASYLSWRYLEHPLFEYRVRVAGAPGAPAVCVYRIERTRGSAAVDVGRIVELFGPDGEQDLVDAVLAVAVEEMRVAGCLMVDFYCTGAAAGLAARKAGLQVIREGLLPSRLSPVQSQPRAQNLEYWVKPGTARPKGMHEMYVTKSDGDQDRPN
jgi:hypothetical protein